MCCQQRGEWFKKGFLSHSPGGEGSSDSTRIRGSLRSILQESLGRNPLPGANHIPTDGGPPGGGGKCSTIRSENFSVGRTNHNWKDRFLSGLARDGIPKKPNPTGVYPTFHGHICLYHGEDRRLYGGDGQYQVFFIIMVFSSLLLKKKIFLFIHYLS